MKDAVLMNVWLGMENLKSKRNTHTHTHTYTNTTTRSSSSSSWSKKAIGVKGRPGKSHLIRVELNLAQLGEVH